MKNNNLIFILCIFLLPASSFPQTYDLLKDFEAGKTIAYIYTEDVSPSSQGESDYDYADTFNGTFKVHIDSISYFYDSLRIFFLTVHKQGVHKIFTILKVLSLSDIDTTYGDTIYEYVKETYNSGAGHIKGWFIPDSVFYNRRCYPDTTILYPYNKYYRYYNLPSADTFSVNQDTLKFKTTSGDCMDIGNVSTYTITQNDGILEFKRLIFYAFSWSYTQTYTKTDVSAIVNTKQKSQSFEILQNYPNPFNPSTIIEYQLPVSGFTTIKVFDALGKEIATLVNEFKACGEYSINFNGANLASGIYFCKIQAGVYSKSIKMLLMK